MTDPVPDERNRLAYRVGLVFHPYLICIVTLIVILADVPLPQALGWLAVMAAILLLPLMLVSRWLKRRRRYVYQRASRTPIYLTFWLSLVVCLGLLVSRDAPRVLIICVVTLMVWLPVQLAINTLVTKVSIHAAVIAGCVMGLLLLGKLEPLPVLLGALAVVALTLWARVVTRHHTVQQVVLGVLTGIIPVLIVFPLLLGRS